MTQPQSPLRRLEAIGSTHSFRILIPHLMLDCMVKNGILENVWRLPNVRDHRAGRCGVCEAGKFIVAGSGASTCWADFILNKRCHH